MRCRQAAPIAGSVIVWSAPADTVGGLVGRRIRTHVGVDPEIQIGSRRTDRTPSRCWRRPAPIPFGLPATDETPFQSPTLPSRLTFAAHTRPDVATRSTQRTSNPLPGNFLRYQATVANSIRPSGTTSQPDKGMACAAPDGGGALPCNTIVNAAVVSCPPVALVLATSTFSVPPAGSDDSGMKVSIAAVPCDAVTEASRPSGGGERAGRAQDPGYAILALDSAHGGAGRRRGHDRRPHLLDPASQPRTGGDRTAGRSIVIGVDEELEPVFGGLRFERCQTAQDAQRWNDDAAQRRQNSRKRQTGAVAIRIHRSPPRPSSVSRRSAPRPARRRRDPTGPGC